MSASKRLGGLEPSSSSPPLRGPPSLEHMFWFFKKLRKPKKPIKLSKISVRYAGEKNARSK